MSAKPLGVPALVAIAFIAGAILAALVGPVNDGIDTIFGQKEGASQEAVDVIQDNYFEEVDRDQLESDSVRGMVETLKKRYKDRFSHYFGPHAYGRFKQVTEGSFSGVGLSVTEVKQGLRVATVFNHSPADEGGIKEGEIVSGVDGRSLAGEDAELATAEIKGRPGTQVTLTVLDPRTKTSRDVPLTRRQLHIPAVEARLEHVNGVPVGYIQLLGFSSGAHAELRRAAENLYAKGAKGLVLDLRGNGGGLLTEAVATSSVFVEDGPIVSTQSRTQGETTLEAAGDALPEHPMVVLIDKDTASASEILTAALEQAGLAAVVGETSFGKGTFQEVIPLDNGGALDLTIGEYLTRDGTSINGTGIPPDVKAKDLPATKPDEGLQKALQVLAPNL